MRRLLLPPARRMLLLPVLGILIFSVACEGPTVPPKLIDEIYDFRLATDPPSVLRWPSGTRVRVHVESAAGPREQVLTSTFQAAAAEWNRHALYGEYQIVHASSLLEADVLLRWSDEVSPVDLTDCTPLVSVAVTTFCLDDDDPTHLARFPLLPPNDDAASNVSIVVSILGTLSVQPDSVIRGLVTHEMGHALGMARHSSNANDLMAAGEVSRLTLSRRDVATVQTLYHTQPEITP